jgi:biotin carboxyl carrier protein
VQAGGIGRTERTIEWTKAQARASFETSRYAFLWILLVGLAGLWLVPTEVRLWRWHRRLSLFERPTQAAEFVRTLWQVEASVVALSITVIIFAFQAVSTSRHNIKLYEFAEDVHLFPVFYVGVVGLIVDGLVLLGFGNGAPAGGAASWAILVSGSAFPLLAWLFTRTVRALDPDELHRRRLARIREETYQAAEHEIFQRFAQDLLEQRCNEANVELHRFLLGSPPAGSKEIAAPLSGHVRDIDPKKLKSLTEGGLSGVKLLVYVGARVAEGQTIVVLPSSATKKVEKRARQVVRIEEDEG